MRLAKIRCVHKSEKKKFNHRKIIKSENNFHGNTRMSKSRMPSGKGKWITNNNIYNKNFI